MMENLHDFIEFRIDTDKHLLYGKWLRDVNNAEYRAGLHKVHELINSFNLKRWLQDSSELKPRDVQDQKFAAEEFGILLAQSPVKYIAIVVSRQSAHYPVLLSLREKAYRIFGKVKYLELFETEKDALGWLIPNMQHYRLPATIHSN